MRKKLHELIEMAKRGEKFEAQTSFSVPLKEKTFLQKDPWSESFICAEWTVRMKREPRVQWINELDNGTLGENWDKKEEAESFGKPIKFIEVIDEQA